MQGVVLFAHGARDPRWAEPFRLIEESLQKSLSDKIVRLCFLELMTPGLPDTVQSMVESHCQELWIVPLFMAQGGHLRQDLPKLVDQLKERYPEVLFRQTPAIGDVPQLLEAITQWIGMTVKGEGAF